MSGHSCHHVITITTIRGTFIPRRRSHPSILRLSAWSGWLRPRRLIALIWAASYWAMLMTAQLQFRNLTLGYDRHPAVHHLDGAVRPAR